MNVKFLLDENMPFALLDFLRNKNHEANHLKKLDKVGIKNGEVYKLAEHTESWILTRDSDFKSYHKFKMHYIKGIIIFSLSDTTTRNIINVINKFLNRHTDKLASKHLIIINDNEIKIYE